LDSSTCSLDNPKTLSLRRGQLVEQALAITELTAGAARAPIEAGPAAEPVTAEATPADMEMEAPFDACPAVEPVTADVTPAVMEMEAPFDACPAVEPVPAADPVACPRCKGKLINPQVLGWCPKCGYCRSLEKDQAAAKLVTDMPAAKSALTRFGDMGELVAKIPSWGWIAAAGICTILILATFANYVFPQEESLARALISLLGVVLSIIVILFTNLWALFRLGADNEHLGPKDVFLCAGIWRCICRNLPDTRRIFWTGSWCLTAFISACFIVGGFDYWWELYKPKRVAKAELLSAVDMLARGARPEEYKSLEEAVRDMASKQGLAGKLLGEKKAQPVTKEITQCVIIGYTLDDDNELTSLVVAALLKDRIRYAGTVRKGFDPKKSAELLAALKPLAQPKSYIPGLAMTATWVKPSVLCEIAHQDFDLDHHFMAPEFKGLLSGN
jgi:hypothetical protein